ncbi:MAG: hypothetical protein HY976_03675, partial [Candidatus Kerfeldbacteria bacterium]|nr:hypothetical protein [Candidatus Kerfeldbacteria bacterium]
MSQLVVGTDSGSANTDQTISTSDLESTGGNGYENGDDAEEDVMYSVANSDLTVDDDNNKTEQFYIMHGETYRPASGGGGDTTTHHLEIDSTAVITADSNAFNVAGDFTNGGTFTANTSTVTFNGAAAQTVVTNAQGFNAIVVNNTGTTGTGDDVTISGALDVNGTLTITDGDLQLATNDPNVTTAGDVNLNASTALVTKADNGTATWTFDGTGTSTWTDSATTTQDLGLVIIDGTTKTVNMGSSVRATKLTVTDTFGLASSGYTLTLTGTGQAAAKPLTVTGTFNEGTNSTVDYIGNGATDITLETYWNLSVRPAGTATHYVPSAATMNVSGNLIVGDGANAGTFNLSTNAASIDVNGNVTINASAVLSASGSGDIWVGGSYANSGTFTSNSGNFTFDATSSGKTVSGSLTGANAFGKLTFNGTNGEWTIQNSMDVTDSFDVGAGTLIHGANTTLAVTGATFTLTAGITWTKTSGTGKLLLDNVTELLFADNTTPKQNLGAVQIGASPGTTTLSTDMSADSVTIPTGDTFNTKGYEVTTTGAFDCQGTCTLDLTSTGGEVDGTIIDVGGDFTMSSSATFTSFTNSKIFINATSGNKTFTTGGKAYFDVELKNTDGTNDDITISGSPFDINGALTLTDGQIRLDTNDPNVTLAGSLSIAAAATVTKADNGTATWTFDGTGTSTWTDSTSGVQDLGLVAINGTTKTINLGSNAKATKLTIAASQTFGLGSSGYSFTLTGSGTALNQPFQNSGTLNEGTNSTFIFAGTDGTTLDPDTFYNLTIAPNGGAGPLYTLDYNETTNPTNVLGNFTLGDNTNAVSLNCPAFANFDIDGDVLIRTSATMISSGDTGMVYIGGSYTNNGTYTEGGNGLTFNATTTGKTINGNLTGANAMAIIFNGSGGEWTNTAALDAVTIVMTAGTFAGTANVTTTNQVIGTAGIINRTGGTFEIRPNLNINIGPTTASTNWTFNNLTFGNSHASTGLTVTKQSCATCGVTVTGTLSIGKTGDTATTTLNAGDATWTLSGTGQTPLSILASPAGALTASTSTFNYSGANGAGNVDVTAATYNNLGVGTTSDGTAETYVLAGDTTVGSVLTIGNASSGASDALDGSTRTLTLSGSGTPLVLTSQGTYTASSSTVNYTGTPSTITIAGTTYNNLGVGTTSDSNAVTYQLGGNTSVGSVLTVGNSGSTNNDTLDGSSRTLTLSGSGTPLNFTSRGVFSASTSTVNFTGGSATNVPGVTYNNVGIGDGATVTYTTLATPTVGGALVLAANSTLALGFGHTLNLNTSTCSLTLPASATISGTANLYWYCNSNTFPTTGTIN